ncbi:MAG: ribulose-5-phosphate 4-epimerase [Mycetocola sp.]|jgi:ribulose-5-phosphate 4-epimerase/fuculose-1-phosphate aldolase|nr:ribulose-5-phosphate 4-epimerase [Mycetocola sp.]
MMMTKREAAIEDLVIANRMLGKEGILDAFGHVSIRDPENPQRYLMSRARSPEVIEPSDIMLFEMDGAPVDSPEVPYIERHIHGAMYEARPDIMAVCHNHTLSVLPFGISTTVKLTAVINTARFLGEGVPVWDIAEDFGDTDLLVRDMTMGRSLALRLGNKPVALMRGHGSVVASDDIARLVTMCIGMDRNARVQLEAARLGEFRALTAGEVAVEGYDAGRGGDNRAWEYFKRRAAL